MTRRRFLLASALGVLAPGVARTQAGMKKVGILLARPLKQSFYAPPLVQRLGELGYRDGRSMVLVDRATEIVERFPALARELVELKCHVIFAVGPEAPVRALQNAQAPAIVFVAVDYDPLERGVITSLRTPDRNTTGVYVPQDALAVKRLQIMREVMPDARRFLVFSDSFSRDQLAALRVAADRAGLQLTVVEFSRPPYDFASAMESGRRAKVEAFVGLTSPIFANRGDDIAQALHEHRIPGAAWNAVPGVMKAGFVFGYGDDPAKVGRKGAEIGARILKGAKPADIPVEQADQFDFFINSAVAQQLGVNIPESLRARATRFVQ